MSIFTFLIGLGIGGLVATAWFAWRGSRRELEDQLWQRDREWRERNTRQ